MKRDRKKKIVQENRYQQRQKLRIIKSLYLVPSKQLVKRNLSVVTFERVLHVKCSLSLCTEPQDRVRLLASQSLGTSACPSLC